MPILNDVVRPVLEQLDLNYWLHKDEDAVLVDVPHEAQLPGSLTYVLRADEQHADVLITSFLGRVPGARVRQAGVFLLGENSRRKYVTFSMDQRGLVIADVCIDMNLTADPKKAVWAGLVRLMKAVEDAVPGLVKAARLNGNPRLSRLERQVKVLTRGLAQDGTAQAPGE